MTKETIREEFEKDFVDGRHTLHLGWGIAQKEDANVIADWWLAKFDQLHEQKMKEIVEGVEKLRTTIPPYPAEGAHGHAITLAAQRGYQDGVNDVLALLTEKAGEVI